MTPHPRTGRTILAPLVIAALTLSVLLASPSAPLAASPPFTALAPVDTFADGFHDLRGLAIDPAGNVYVADRAAGRVWRLAPDHSRTVVASGLQRPVGLALDPGGRLLIAEERAGRVVRLDANGSRTPLLSGVKQPRWLAVRDDGTLYVAARRLTRGTDPEPDDESAEPEMVLALSPTGTLSVFADGFRKLQGLVLNHDALFAVTQGRSGARAGELATQLSVHPSHTERFIKFTAHEYHEVCEL